jgi:hypothetical protein
LFWRGGLKHSVNLPKTKLLLGCRHVKVFGMRKTQLLRELFKIDSRLTQAL